MFHLSDYKCQVLICSLVNSQYYFRPFEIQLAVIIWTIIFIIVWLIVCVQQSFLSHNYQFPNCKISSQAKFSSLNTRINKLYNLGYIWISKDIFISYWHFGLGWKNVIFFLFQANSKSSYLTVVFRSPPTWLTMTATGRRSLTPSTTPMSRSSPKNIIQCQVNKA